MAVLFPKPTSGHRRTDDRLENTLIPASAANEST